MESYLVFYTRTLIFDGALLAHWSAGLLLIGQWECLSPLQPLLLEREGLHSMTHCPSIVQGSFLCYKSPAVVQNPNITGPYACNCLSPKTAEGTPCRSSFPRAPHSHQFPLPAQQESRAHSKRTLASQRGVTSPVSASTDLHQTSLV